MAWDQSVHGADVKVRDMFANTHIHTQNPPPQRYIFGIYRLYLYSLQTCLLDPIYLNIIRIGRRCRRLRLFRVFFANQPSIDRYYIIAILFVIGKYLQDAPAPRSNYYSFASSSFRSFFFFFSISPYFLFFSIISFFLFYSTSLGEKRIFSLLIKHKHRYLYYFHFSMCV